MLWSPWYVTSPPCSSCTTAPPEVLSKAVTQSPSWCLVQLPAVPTWLSPATTTVPGVLREMRLGRLCLGRPRKW